VRKPGLFIIAALAAVGGVLVLPSRLSLLGAMVVSLAAVQLLGKLDTRRPQNG
jgi:hypothetical protein